MAVEVAVRRIQTRVQMRLLQQMETLVLVVVVLVVIVVVAVMQEYIQVEEDY